jgi:hypothetical protein
MRRALDLASRSISLVLLASIWLLPGFGRAAHPPTPNPVLFLSQVEYVTVGGKAVVRYNYGVMNSADFSNDLFAKAPALPPCGANTNASRSWVDLYDMSGKRLNGFCALGKNSDLNGVWFTLPVDAIPPSYIYIEITDRQTNTKYKSNLADTTM